MFGVESLACKEYSRENAASDVYLSGQHVKAVRIKAAVPGIQLARHFHMQGA